MSSTNSTEKKQKVTLDVQQFNTFKSIVRGIADLKGTKPDNVVHRVCQLIPEEHYGDLIIPEPLVKVVCEQCKSSDDPKCIHDAKVTECLDSLRENSEVELENAQFVSKLGHARHGNNDDGYYVQHLLTEGFDEIVEQVRPHVENFGEEQEDLYDEGHISLALFVQDPEAMKDYAREHGVPETFEGKIKKLKHIVPFDPRRKSFLILNLDDESAALVSGFQESFPKGEYKKPFSPHISVLRTSIVPQKMDKVDFSGITTNSKLAQKLNEEF